MDIYTVETDFWVEWFCHFLGDILFIAWVLKSGWNDILLW